ncbi:MAG: ABC transporter ATP-binding protein [Lachnospiraceae bacterium]|nr:ABC transporter ATP-binding protein [Lachnospiraceae bacterium]
MKRLLKFLKSYRKECVIAPLFKLLEAAFELFVPKVMASIIDVGIKNHDGPYVIKMGLVLVALAVIGLSCAVTAQFFAAKAAVGFSTKLREVLFGHIEDLSFTDIDQAGTSTLITRMTSDVNQVQSGVNMTLRLFLRSPIIVFGAMIMAFTVDVEMAWIFVIAIPILAIIVFGIMLLTMPLYKKVQSGLDKVLGITRENLTGVRVIRAFHQEETEKTRFDESNQALTAMQKFVGRISACMNPVTYVIVNLAIMILIYKGAVKVQIGDLSQGQVIAILDYMSMILVELVKLANLIILMTKALACADRVASVLEIGTDVGENGNDAANGKDQTENGTAEGKSGAQGAAAASDDAQPVETFVGASVAERKEANYLVFDHVAMKYCGAGEETLEDVSFAVRKGDTVGVIGGTGSGKSSLVNLIPGFYPATQGRILLEGKELSSFDEAELRNRMGIVPQKAVLFQGTIRSNLLWGKPDATEEEMWNALELAQAKEIVEGKDGRLDAEVAQNGRNFSGGQRQRLTIARALVRKPEILILDDSASALDYATDAKLRASVRSIKDQTTTFIVSQRASSIRHADLIIVLDDGRVAGLGTHDELLASCEVYQEIYYSQYPEERKGAVTNG